MAMSKIANDLCISMETLRYYLGRYVQSDLHEEEILNTIGRVAILRKMGCSSLQIKTIAETNCIISDLTPARRFGADRTQYSSVAQRKWTALTYIDCVEASKICISKTPWYDRMFWGRLIDDQSVLVAIPILIHYIVRHVDNSANILEALSLSGFVLAGYAVIRTLGDKHREKVNIVKLQGF